MPRGRRPRIAASPVRAEVAKWVLAVLVLGSALALGGVHTSALCVIAVVAAAGFALAWWDADPIVLRPSARIVVATAVVLTAWTTLQLVPLPMWLLAKIAPANADVWTRCLSALG